MTFKDIILEHLKKSNGIITSAYCDENNIPRIYLTRLVDENILIRVDNGIYMSKDGDFDEYYFFQYKYKKTIFSYESALYLLNHTDKVPQNLEVSISYNYKISRIHDNIVIHYVKKDIINLGMVEVKTIFGNVVKTYNFERVLCDVISNKEKVDSEIYIKTIRRYAEYSEKNLNKLYDYSNIMGITNRVRDVMEVVI